MTGGPGSAGVLDAGGIEVEGLNLAAIVSRVGGVCGHAVHILWKSLGGAVIVQMAEVGIKGTVFLRHKDDVIDCGNIASVSTAVAVAISSATAPACASTAIGQCAPGHEQRKNGCYH